jgi:hypothetical protein
MDSDQIPDCQDNDVDGDGKLNYQDTDTDNDTVPDIQEYPGTNPRVRQQTRNCTNKTIDSDKDDILDCEDDDVDGDGLTNQIDLDSDGDGVSDKDEGFGDSDGNGLPNFLDKGTSVVIEKRPAVYLPILMR